MPEVSHNQLTVTLVKACVGAGVARGVAEDLGRAIALLQPNKRDGAMAELCDALDQFTLEAHPVAPSTVRDGAAVVAKAKLLHHGPGLVELAMVKADNGQSTLVEQFDCPTCLEALVLAAPANGEIERSGDGLTLTFTPQEGSEYAPRAPASLTRGHVDRTTWARLLRHAQATMVPNDATSQADAGAGNSDND